ncbi:hypothetical protein ACJDU8_17220 [Clostridium sp. WILCCON 0269]|uniref:Uncharacterized protein n=1 Tax=Candidatus Clostridium eludens TaxID=3381663 RepID=A0ABW8SMV0_9CLOT
MKYTERTGTFEFTYEGTPEEIMNLYNKMNSNKPPNINFSPRVHCEVTKTKKTSQERTKDYTLEGKDKMCTIDFKSIEESLKRKAKDVVQDVVGGALKRSLEDKD